MKTLASGILSVCLIFAVPGLTWAKGSQDRRGNSDRTQGHPTGKGSENPKSNAKGSADRDFGTDRAKEVGKGEKKGLYKDHHSTEKDKHKTKKEKVKKEKHDKN